MSLNKPYYRITRSLSDGVHSRNNAYMLDSNYANDRFVSIRAFHLLVADLIKLFDYVEPCNANTDTYSHRIYELFLRASTELESNCKAILNANGYVQLGRMTMQDYSKINAASKLHEYEVKFNTWSPIPLVLSPFSEWNPANVSILTWYKNYNGVKHERNVNFHLANLDNLMNSVSSVFVILYSQFGINVFDPYQTVGSYTLEDDGYITTDNSLFMIKPPCTWNNDESYEFDWQTISGEAEPINQYNFN